MTTAIKITDYYPFTPTQIFHRMILFGEVLQDIDAYENFEYVLVSSTTNQLQHYSPPFTKVATPTPSIVSVEDASGNGVYGLSCFIHNSSSYHGAPHTKYLFPNKGSCFTNTSLDNRLGMVVDKDQLNRLGKKPKDTVSVMHCAVYPKTNGLLKADLLDAFVTSGTWQVCNLIAAADHYENQVVPEPDVSHLINCSFPPLDQNLVRLCSLFQTVLFGRCEHPTVGCKLWLQLIEMLEWFKDDAPPTFDSLLINHGVNTHLCMLMDALSARYLTSPVNQLLDEIGHFQTLFMSTNRLLSEDYELLNIAADLHRVFSSRFEDMCVLVETMQMQLSVNKQPFIACLKTTTGNPSTDERLFESLQRGHASISVFSENELCYAPMGIAKGLVKACVSGDERPADWKKLRVVVFENTGEIHEVHCQDVDDDPIFKEIFDRTGKVVRMEIEDKWVSKSCASLPDANSPLSTLSEVYRSVAPKSVESNQAIMNFENGPSLSKISPVAVPNPHSLTPPSSSIPETSKGNVDRDDNDMGVGSVLCGCPLGVLTATVEKLTQCSGYTMQGRRCARRKRHLGEWYCYQHEK